MRSSLTIPLQYIYIYIDIEGVRRLTNWLEGTECGDTSSLSLERPTSVCSIGCCVICLSDLCQSHDKFQIIILHGVHIIINGRTMFPITSN